MSAQADDTPTAISNVLQVLRASFRTREARRLSEIYAEDADWTNALGTNLKGSEQIVDYLTGLFADSHFGAGQAGTPQVSIRLVTPDVFHSSLSPLHCCKGALFRRQSPKYHVSQCNDLAAKRRGDTRMRISGHSISPGPTETMSIRRMGRSGARCPFPFSCSYDPSRSHSPRAR